MRKTILTYGVISGLISASLMVMLVTLIGDHGTKGMLFGYAAMVLSFLLVYFGIRSYRDNVGGGQISFGKAFGVGILITLISCTFYVVTWEILYFNFMHGFMDSYAASVVAKLKASGASAAVIQAKVAEMAKFKQQYENVFFNAAMTFIEPFPVGLVMTLVSAGVLRKKAPRETAGVTAATA